MIEVLKQMVDVLEYWDVHGKLHQPTEEAIQAGKQAIAELESQEPVAWGVFEGNLHDMFFTQEEAQEMARLKGSHAEVRPLYTYPPQRTEQGDKHESTTSIYRFDDKQRLHRK
jgi:formylglycine-generating enzyme required for sulfatase activity